MKAQIIGRIFIYILALVIMALILVYGYNAIKSFLQTGENINLIEAKNNIKDNVGEMGSQYGSLKQYTVQIPSRFSKVCFIDLDATIMPSETNICDSSKLDFNPLICNSWTDKVTMNLFFVESKTKVEPHYVGNLVVDGTDDNTLVDADDTACTFAPAACYFLCLDVNQGKIKFWLKGAGGKALVSNEMPS